ncbi:MAG: hypothetical protein MUP70_17090, partial [Candidatus Aminicenantes bacterium]|nr:hypothetical protein [Candidatus Aminicenantes bacterium]
WAEKEARFNLMLAGSLPDVVLNDPVITEKDGEYTITVEVENRGFIPTALKQALLVKMVRPDTISLEFPEDILPPRRRGRGSRGMEMGGGQGGQDEPQAEAKVQIVEPKGFTPSIEIGRIPGNDKVTAVFKLKLKDIDSAPCTVRYTSTRGGVCSKDIVIGHK